MQRVLQAESWKLLKKINKSGAENLEALYVKISRSKLKDQIKGAKWNYWMLNYINIPTDNNELFRPTHIKEKGKYNSGLLKMHKKWETGTKEMV